jgi:hypothetical protein
MTIKDIVEEVFVKHDEECLRLTEQLNRTIIERNEARREVCKLYAIYSRFYNVDDQQECAKDRGWDCFKEGTP